MTFVEASELAGSSTPEPPGRDAVTSWLVAIACWVFDAVVTYNTQRFQLTRQQAQDAQQTGHFNADLDGASTSVHVTQHFYATDTTVCRNTAENSAQVADLAQCSPRTDLYVAPLGLYLVLVVILQIWIRFPARGYGTSTFRPRQLLFVL